MAHAEAIEGSVGVFKRWQLMVFLLVFLVNMPLALQELSIVFLAPTVAFNCTDPKYNPCDKNCPGHVFDTSVFDRTIVSQWDLVCDSKWLAEFSQTILMLGILAGNVIFGYLSDRFVLFQLWDCLKKSNIQKLYVFKTISKLNNAKIN